MSAEKFTCEYMPMTFGTYSEPAPEPEVCGRPAHLKLRVTEYLRQEPAQAAIDWINFVRSQGGKPSEADIDAARHAAQYPVAARHAAQYSVAEVFEAYSCIPCFSEALEFSGHDSDFDPNYDDLDLFETQCPHDPAYGRKFEILEKL